MSAKITAAGKVPGCVRPAKFEIEQMNCLDGYLRLRLSSADLLGFSVEICVPNEILTDLRPAAERNAGRLPARRGKKTKPSE